MPPLASMLQLLVDQGPAVPQLSPLHHEGCLQAVLRKEAARLTAFSRSCASPMNSSSNSNNRSSDALCLKVAGPELLLVQRHELPHLRLARRDLPPFLWQLYSRPLPHHPRLHLLTQAAAVPQQEQEQEQVRVRVQALGQVSCTSRELGATPLAMPWLTPTQEKGKTRTVELLEMTLAQPFQHLRR